MALEVPHSALVRVGAGFPPLTRARLISQQRDRGELSIDAEKPAPTTDLEYTFVKPGGIIILDDAWRYESVHAMSRAKRHLIMQGLGPYRAGVSRTDIFEY